MNQKEAESEQSDNQTGTESEESRSPRVNGKRWIDRVKKWLSANGKLSETRKAIVLNDLIETASPGLDFLVLIILSCTIATFGLIANSPAVIIGAMLVAPLMSPIMALSMASISGLRLLFRRSLTAILVGSVLAIVLSALLSFLFFRLPYGALANIPAEVLSRTSPSLIDLGIALAGGAAAAYALAHPRLSAALPGVAIATALMPPICTIGIGISFLNPSIFLGALLLFATNLAAISFAGILTFALMGFRPRKTSEKDAVFRSLRISALLVLAISVPLGIFAWTTISDARTYSQASRAVLESASEITDVRLVELGINSEKDVSKVKVVLRTRRGLTQEEVLGIQSALADQLDRRVSLELVTVPMQILDPLNPPTPTPTTTPSAITTSTPTPTPSPTPLPTKTPVPSPTPLPGFISFSGGVSVHNLPEGEIRFNLPMNSAVWVFGDQIQEIGNEEWVLVEDTFGRSGWVRFSSLLVDWTPAP